MTPRSLATIVVRLLAGCASAPVTYTRDEVVGHYRGNLAVDTWEEPDLWRDESCVWYLCSAFGGLTRIPVPGRWTIERGDVVITPDPGANGFQPDVIRFTLRRSDGYVYLVSGTSVDWFDEHGPDLESCLYSRAALLEAALDGGTAGEPRQPPAAPEPRWTTRWATADIRLSGRPAMKPDIRPVLGLVFTHSESGDDYGTIRECSAEVAAVRDWTPIAADDCGSAFVISRAGGSGSGTTRRTRSWFWLPTGVGS